MMLPRRTVVKSKVFHAEIVGGRRIAIDYVVHNVDGALCRADAFVSFSHDELTEVRRIADIQWIAAKEMSYRAAQQRPVNQDVDVVVSQGENDTQSVHLGVFQQEICIWFG